MNSQKQDYLLETLVLYTKLYFKPFTAEALIANLPIDEASGQLKLFSTDKAKGLFSRAAKQAGLKSKIIHREIKDIDNLLLPSIVMLRGNKAAILEEVNKETQTVKLIFSDREDIEEYISIEKFQSEYTGYMFLLKHEYEYHSRDHEVIEKKDKHWFWSTITLSKKMYSEAIIASFIVNMFVLATPIFTRNVYDRVVPNNAIETMWVLMIGIFFVYIFDAFIKFLRSYFLEVANKKNDIIISSILFEKILNMRLGTNKSTVGNLANTIKDFDSLKSFFSSATMALVIDIPFVFIFLTVIYILGGKLVIMPILTVLIVLTYTLAVRGKLYRSILASHEASNNKNSVLIESLVNIETIKTMGAHNHAQWVWEEAIGEIASKNITSKTLSASIPLVSGFFTQLNSIGIIAMGVYLINDKELSMGALIAVSMLAGRVISPIGQIASLISSYEQTKLAYEGLENLMKTPSEREEGREYLQRPKFQGSIEFKNVSFAYDEEDKKSLDNVSFKIEAHDKVAILGKIGSGKTTIEKLILGLYEPTEGSILIDDVDISQIDPVNLRANISYVPQDIVLFKGTIKDNITYRSFGADDASILRAAKLSGVDEFIKGHPRGYDMNIGELGVGVSGGQKQSIAISRAFIKNSPIILLDEPTSLMDNTTEANIKINLKEYVKDKTLLLSTHKTSLLDMVDKIMIIDNGKILMYGGKEDVLKKIVKQ